MAHQPERQPDLEPEHDPDAPKTDEESASRPPLRLTGVNLIGQTLEGRYRFDELLGEGTFARVFKVYDLHRRVYLAAKVLRSDIAQEPAFLARFRREAAVLARLQHPHIVRYYDIIESGDVVFILTDYIAGRTLQSVLRQREEPLTPLESLEYLRPLAAALHFAHREGVVHRDLKPANILLDDNNHLYVTDFGIARILSDASTLTVDTTVGTPHYMSPEQIMIGEITAATDVYALGVMLYQMYTGQLPFLGTSQAATGATTAVRIVYEHLHVRPVPPSQHNPALSKAVEDVVLRCLEKDPAQRYSSVSEVYDALNDAIGTPSVSLDSVELSGVRMPAEPEAEHVPTGVGGMSRVVSEDAYALDDDYYEPKRKRKAKIASTPDRVEKGAEKEGEKRDEKEHEQAEKEREKGPEKADSWAEVWGSFGGSDRLNQFTVGGVVVWSGLVFLLGFAPAWSWIMGGAGSLLLAEVAARLVIPEFRARPGGRLVLAAVLMTVGFGSALGLSAWWPLLLIAVGISLLINRLLE
jgi:serine/threonine protein kinase